MSTIVSQLSRVDTTTFDMLPDGVACYEAIRNANDVIVDFQLIYHNPLFEQLMPSVHQQTQPGFLTTLQPRQTAQWLAISAYFIQVIETGQLIEHSLTDPIRQTQVSLRATRFGDGVLVTIRPLAEPLSQAQQQWFNILLNASLNNTIVYEACRDNQGHIQDFRITYANQNAQQDVLARFNKELVGNTLLAVYPNSRQSGQFHHCVQVIETGQPVHIELYYPEVEAWYETLISKLGDGCIVAGLNITARKHNELHVRQQAIEQDRLVQELRQSNESLRQFAQVASHDLQEPLRKIQTFSDILQNQFEDNLSDGERDMTRRIQKSAHRMRLLLKDLLTYSQLAAQRDPLEPVSLNKVVEDVTSDLELVIAEKNATVQVTPLPTVLGSSSRLRQLIQNLIANALKFRQMGKSPLIQINARPALLDELPADLPTSVPFWLISVSDNGLGFDEKYKDRIFHPFQRLHDSAEYSGTGIGLAICQRVVDNHGGAIDVNSRLGEGSTFKIFLPVYEEAT